MQKTRERCARESQQTVKAVMRERRRERKEGGRAGRSGARPGDGSGTEIPRIPRGSARGPAANPPRQRDLRPRIPPDETPFPPSRFLRGRPSRERERFARCACAVDRYSPLEECMAALAFCSLDFCSFGGMVSSSYARSTARADCLWTASLTPGPPFLLVAAGGQLGRLFRVRIPCWAGFFLATRVEIECKLLFALKSGPSDFPKSSRRQRPPPARAVAV